VTHRLSVDRFEGKSNKIAVLLTEGGETISFPRALLPHGVKAGDVLTISLERDAVATRKLVEETTAIQEELRKGDTGGDITL
jgi:hypothetical protein